MGDDNGERIEAAAREAWAATRAQGRRWTYWMRLSWAWPVSEYTAAEHLEEWASSLRRRLPGAAVLVGIHSDTERRHAHALVYVPEAGTLSKSQQALATGWHQERWPHGLIRLDRYSPDRAERADGKHAAALYMGKGRAVGTMMQFGKAPVDRAQRLRERFKPLRHD